MRTILLFLALTIYGCATAGTQIDQNKVSAVQDGVTTRDQVIAMFGQPSSESLGSGGNTIMSYSYVHSQANGASFVPVVGLFAGSTNTNQQVFMVEIDKNGIVVHHLFNNSNIRSSV